MRAQLEIRQDGDWIDRRLRQESRSDARKLARNEVSGVCQKSQFRRDGTADSSRHIPTGDGGSLIAPPHPIYLSIHRRDVQFTRVRANICLMLGLLTFLSHISQVNFTG